jgi:hypothetical protein
MKGGWKSAADFNRQAKYDGKVLRERRRSNADGWIYFFEVSCSPSAVQSVPPSPNASINWTPFVICWTRRLTVACRSLNKLT